MLFHFFFSPIIAWFGRLRSILARAQRQQGFRAADPVENNLEKLSIVFCREEKRVSEKPYLGFSEAKVNITTEG